MKAFKGFSTNKSGQLVCRDMVYEVGKTYKYDGEIELCCSGYHACEKFEDVFNYYSYEKDKIKYYEVECNGDISKSDADSKIVCSEITLLEELHGWWEEYDYVEYFKDEFAQVRLNDKYNHINTDGKLVSNQWFDDVWNFCEGFAVVKLNGKYNFINEEGKLVSNQWFDYVWDFCEGFARVKLNGKWNFINNEGKFISDKWFDRVGYFSEGFAGVKLNDKWNYINTEGKFVSNQWFDVVLDPFSGTFTTCFVAQQLNRHFIGIEIQEEYFKIGLRRLNLSSEYKGEILKKEQKTFKTK